MKKKVAVCNTSKEITTMLLEVMNEEGFNTCSYFTHEIKESKADFTEFIQNEKPDALLYDIGIPYKENYDLFCIVSKLDILKNIPIVLTTTNKKALRSFVGKNPTFELVGKPYDLQTIVNAIKTALDETAR